MWPSSIRTSSDESWREFGESDPYFGVLSQPRFHRDSLDEGALDEFFQTGEDYVDALFGRLTSRLGCDGRFRSALDFGCGVGRLAIPMAGRADHVTGVDISPAMLSEARTNQERRGLTNLEFVTSDEWLQDADARFDLVHTFIVLQHIPPSRGVKLIDALFRSLRPDGVGVFHLTYAKENSYLSTVSWVKKNVPLAKGAINVLRGRPFSTPAMQMNNYDLNRVLQRLQHGGVTELHAEYTDHGGYLGVSLAFRAPAAQTQQRRVA